MDEFCEICHMNDKPLTSGFKLWNDRQEFDREGEICRTCYDFLKESNWMIYIKFGSVKNA